MKQIIISFCEDEEDKEAVINAVKNSIKLLQIYDSVFRPVLKYSDNKNDTDAYQQVWDKLQEYLEE